MTFPATQSVHAEGAAAEFVLTRSRSTAYIASLVQCKKTTSTNVTHILVNPLAELLVVVESRLLAEIRLDRRGRGAVCTLTAPDTAQPTARRGRLDFYGRKKFRKQMNVSQVASDYQTHQLCPQLWV